MRGVMLLASRFYVINSQPTYDDQERSYTASMPTGGTVSVPAPSLVAIEVYADGEIETFRSRIGALETEYAAKA